MASDWSGGLLIQIWNFGNLESGKMESHGRGATE